MSDEMLYKHHVKDKGLDCRPKRRRGDDVSTEATSKGCHSDDIATEQAQIGVNRRNYESIQISTGKTAK